MPRAIRAIHWCQLPSDQRVSGISDDKTVFAIWPAPVDADACFAEAGFLDFADSDELWDSEWRSILHQTIASMSVVGTGIIVQPISAIKEVRGCLFGEMLHRLLSRRPTHWELPDDALTQIELATSDDRYGRVIVQFGEPARATLVAGDGHPILWIGIAAGEVRTDAILVAAAAGRPILQRNLKWNAILPRG